MSGASTLWQDSFREQVRQSAYNTAPVEALVRTVAHYLRARYKTEDYGGLHFLEVGCGAGSNLIWLADKNIRVSGVDIAPLAVELTKKRFAESGHGARLEKLELAGAEALPFADASLDGVLESCVFQHIPKAGREKAFAEVARVLKPGGIFVGHMLADTHTTYLANRAREMKDDPGTVTLGAGKQAVHLEDIGMAHFFRREEFQKLLPGFASVEALAAGYELPREEARRRGRENYYQGMWVVYGVR